MRLAEDKSLVLQFRGSKQNFSLNNQNFTLSEVKDLGILISPDLNFMSHIDDRIKKANNTFYSVHRNVSDLNYDAKLAVFKSSLLPKITFAAPSISLSRASMKKLESFQKRVLKWIAADYHSCYCSLMLKLNVLPLPMFWQLNLDLSKIWHQNTGEIKLYETVKNNRRHKFQASHLGNRTCSL